MLKKDMKAEARLAAYEIRMALMSGARTRRTNYAPANELNRYIADQYRTALESALKRLEDIQD